MKSLRLLLGALLVATLPLHAEDKKPAATTETKDNVKNVTVDEAEKLVKEKKALVLDVRTPEEFAKGHIPGAKNVDFNDDNFVKNVGALDPKTPLLVHCGSGGRSTQALPALKDKAVVYHLKNGFSAWEKAGKPIETGEKK